MIVYPNQKRTINLGAGEVLTISASAGMTGSVIRLARVPGSGNCQSITALSASAVTFGPYALPERFEIICTAGQVEATAAPQELDTDGTLAANSDSRIASQKAVKTYVDASVPAYDAVTYKGVISSLATFPAASKGDMYKITAAGAIGGTGPTVAIGDIAICNTDATVSGTYAAVGTKWDIIPATNIDALSDLIAATAENDMIVAGASPFAWVKKTLTEVKTILGLGSAAYTASTAYVTHAQAIAENDVLVGGPNPFGAWVKKTIAEFKTILGLGSAAYVDTTAFDAAGTAAGKIASSISDSDTTHAPDGNSVFDALALKLNIAQAAPTILQLTEKTPVNAVAASKLLSIGTAPAEGATVSIGGVPYKFRAILGAGVAASSLLTFTGNAVDNETITIDTGTNERVYTFQDAINAAGVKAHGDLTLTGNAVENEVVVLGNGGDAKTYRWRDQIAAIAASKILAFTNVAANTETVTIDTTVYTFVTALTEAKATGILTATANPQDGARVTIGSTTYTFRDTLAVAFDVKIGANAEESLLNLVEAITYDGGAGTNEGTDYGTGTTAHPSVTAAEGAGDTVDVTALAIGVAGNAVTAVEYSPGLSWGHEHLEGGLDAVPHEVLVEATAEAEIDNLVACATAGAGAGTKYSTGETAHATVTVAKKDADEITATAKTAGTAGNSIPIDESCTDVAWTADAKFLGGGYDTAVANDVIIGGTAELSIDNLVLAVNCTSGEGVNYGTGTTAHTTIDAAKTAADVFTATAKSIGDTGDAYVTTTTMTLATWDDTTMNGGEGVDIAYDVLIGANAEASIDNLVAAINKAAGEGTTYGTGTVAHPTVTAAKTAADGLTATAKSVGDAGNLIDSESTVALAAWAAGHLTGGYDAQAANDVLIGTVEESIDNLVLAVTAGANEGVKYGTGTVVNSLATAVKASASTMTATNLIKGVIGNLTAIAETLADGSWAGAAVYLTGGVDGTVGVANETCVDGSYLYHAIAANTIADANWRKLTLLSL